MIRAVIWAIIWTATPAAATDPLEPPPALEWPADLPAQVPVPAGRLHPADPELTAIDVPAGTLLPKALADHVRDRLIYLDQIPGLCGVKLRGLADIGTADLKAATRNAEAVCRTRMAEQAADAAGRFAWWEVIAWTAGGVAVGVVAGIVLGIAAGL